MSDNKRKSTYRRMQEFLDKDPVPGMRNVEVEMMTDRVLSRVKLKQKPKWFEIRPAYQIGFAIAAVLVLAIGITFILPELSSPGTSPEMNAAEFLAEESEPEELVVDAMIEGSIGGEEILRDLMGLGDDELEVLASEYEPESYLDKVEELSEEEAEAVLEMIDELGYPGEKGA